MIYELHRKTKSNIGDYWCNPSRYFNLNAESYNISTQLPIEGNSFIIGGGGLIHKKFSPFIENIINNNPKHVIIWGIGTNYFLHAKNKDYPNWLEHCSLIGLRDKDSKNYLPCVSCMHPAFNKTYNIKHDVVFYTHKSKSSFNRTDAPNMSNAERNFDKVIDFLGSGKTVVTDSYHGAYWAMLLGRNVQVKAWSTKFLTLKNTPVMLEDINYPSNELCSLDSNYLTECRDLNNQFYQKVLPLLN